MSKVLIWIMRHAPGVVSKTERSSRNIIILRHDVDNSRDTTFLNFEREHRVPATWALLLDRNLRFWLRNLKGDNDREIAYHYPSNRVSLDHYLARMARRVPISVDLHEENRSRQFRFPNLPLMARTARRLGVPTRTLHRHYSFVRYPILIEQLDDCSRRGLIEASASLFQATVLWGRSRSANGASHGYTHPEGIPGSSMWWPFRCHNPAMNESTSYLEFPVFQEPTADVLWKLFSSRTPMVSQRLVVVSLHPAHANSATFRHEGQIETLREIFAMREDLNLEFYSLGGFLVVCV